MVETNAAHTFCEKRDLDAEISKDEAIKATASVITEFMEVHQVKDDNKARKKSLLQKIKSTEDYLQPLLDAMKLEGNYNLRTPCNLVEECDCDDCNKGSSWVESIQLKLLPENVQAEEIADEFRRTWYINPFADPPFYHPHVDQSTSGENKVNIGTVTEGVYEKQDYFFDGGFFSNTAVELRSKLNSPQAIMDALDVPIPFEAGCNTCSKMNEMTINWALDHAPEIVKKRYKERGIKLQAGVDISHNNGPTWIWSYLDFTKEGVNDENEPCRIIDSHTMTTPLDHPVPFAGGKLYCKLLSPARVLDWMYTDSLRQS